MARTLRVSCVQLTSGPDKASNLETAERLVARAASAGADVVVLPEKWNGIGNRETAATKRTHDVEAWRDLDLHIRGNRRDHHKMTAQQVLARRMRDQPFIIEIIHPVLVG